MKYMKLGSKPDSFQTDGNNIRFVATELATDIVVNVADVKFYLHKFPLLSKSSRLQKMVAAIDEEINDEIDIPDIPGGPAAFEICAKFCYGMTVTLNAYDVVAARCAAEYLEMHETLEKGNLIYKIEVFLNTSIFRSWKDSIIVLQTTKSLLPWSEDLKVVSRCIDSIASRASIDPSEVEWSYTYNRRKLPSENGIDAQWNGVRKQPSVPKDWWVEDLCELEIDSYMRVIMAIRAKGRLSDEVIGEALKAYTYRRVAGFGKGSITNGDVSRNRALLETIVCLLPPTIGSVPCSFLLKLMKGLSMVASGENYKKELRRRIGRQLQEASVSDLLIPSSEGDTMYDIETVTSIVQEFVMQEHGSGETSPSSSEELQEVRSPVFVAASAKLAVAKLLDGYLAEIAKDPNLPISKFIEVAEMVSGSARPVHDGLYKAIDTFLMEHPGLTKSEKKMICSLMDCKKLTADACSHAIQNERLPLRMVVQVLFFEQVRASAAYAAPSGGSDPPGSARSLLPRENGASYGSSRSAATTNTEDEWDGVHIAGESLKSMSLAGRGRGGTGSEQSGGSGDASKAGNGKVKGALTPKKLMSKLWSSKGHGAENSSSDTSGSPGGSTNPEETKSTPSRNTRHSVS